MRAPRDTQVEDCIAASFKVADDAGAERRTRIWEAMQRKSKSRPWAITVPRMAVVACAAVAIVVLLTIVPMGPAGSPAPAMAKVAQGLKALDAPEIVHYRVSYVGRLTERGHVVRSDTRTEECWIDRERRMARSVTSATSSNGAVEAAYGVYVTKDGVTRELQIDKTQGKRVINQKESQSGRNWSDDFDGTISYLRTLLDGTEKYVGLTTQILGVDVFRGERVVLVRTSYVEPSSGYQSTQSQTFWLRQRDYVPMQIEDVRSEQSDDGETMSEYREVRTFTDYERLQRSEAEPDLFELKE